MINNSISAMVSEKVDRPSLQSLLLPAKPKIEFNSLMAKAERPSVGPRAQQVEDTRHKADYQRSDERSESTHSGDSKQRESSPSSSNVERSEYSQGDDRSAREDTQPTEALDKKSKADQASSPQESTPEALSDEASAVNASESANNDGLLAEQAEEGGIIIPGVLSELALKVEGSEENITIVTEAGLVDQDLMVDSDLAVAEAVVAASAATTAPLVKAAELGLVGKPVNSSLADPLSQVIEVEQLLADKGSSFLDGLKGMAKPDFLAANSDGVRLGNLTSTFKTDFLRLAEGQAAEGALSDAKGALLASVSRISGSAVNQFLVPVSGVAPVTTAAMSPSLGSVQSLMTGLPVAMGQPSWGQAVGEKVLMMAAKNLSSAEIQLDPPELGQLQVRVTLNHDQATVTFVSPQQSVREALDDSAQRLREMFEGEGLDLVNVDVSDQSQSDLSDGENQNQQATGDGVEELDGAEVVSQSVNMNLVDHYA